MTTYRVGYIIGSLSGNSINRTLSKALIRLAPPELEFVEIPIKDLPLYNHDYDDDYPPEGQAPKAAIVVNWERLEGTFGLPDIDDEHVVALHWLAERT